MPRSSPFLQERRNVTAADLNNDGWIDVVYTASTGTHIAWNKNGAFETGPPITRPDRALRSLTWKIVEPSISSSDPDRVSE